VSGTVTAIIDDLAARGLVRDLDQTVPTRGRPQRLVKAVGGRTLGAWAWVRPTEVVVGLTDLVSGEEIWSGSSAHAAGSSGGDALAAAVAGGLDQAWEQAARIPGAWFAGSAVAALGPVVDESLLLVTLDLPISNYDLGNAVEERLVHRHDVRVFNDGRLGALAEYQALPPDVPRFGTAYISSLCAGVFGGLIVNGEGLGGEHGLAGEVGHIVVDKDGPRCRCGASGCLTTFLSTRALLERSGVPADRVPSDDGAAIQELVGLLEAHDAAALHAVETGGEALAAAVATLSNLCDVGAVILGGHLLDLAPWIAAPVADLISSRAAVSEVFNPVVRSAAFGQDAPCHGAWMRLARTVRDDPLAVPMLEKREGCRVAGI
jgi:predicted NBD/HSP70 family sugar kinase